MLIDNTSLDAIVNAYQLPRTDLNPASGTLAIMMASGMISDFELVQSDGETFVRIWSPANEDRAMLRRHVAAILPRHIEERHVTVLAVSET